MQDFINQAIKNEETLLEVGKCQFCGAYFPKGIFDCIDNYNNGLLYLDFNIPEHHISRFLSVDAHALQHPEIHGRWSNHFHLTRLNFILDKKQHWNYKKSPLLSDYLNEYKLNSPNEFLTVPKPFERGTITTKDLVNAKSEEGSIELIKKWANEVYFAWKINHNIVSEIAIGFLGKGSSRKKKR